MRKIVGSPVGYHYGIWVAIDEVVHASKTKRVVVCDSLEEFSARLDVRISDRYSDLCRSNSDLVIERARSEVGKWSYELMDRNCEAFVHWCVTGEKSPGLQIGAIKLVGEVTKSLVIAPVKAARERDESRRRVERQIAQILRDNAQEDEAARSEFKYAIAAERARGAEIVTDESRLEEMLVRHGEYQSILHRWSACRRRRNTQYVEMLKIAIAHGDSEAASPLLEAEQRCIETCEDARKSLVDVAIRISSEIRRFLVDQMREDILPIDRVLAHLNRLNDQIWGMTLADESRHESTTRRVGR